jgi:hypothetical protein
VHAHEITVAEAREMFICCFRASKRFENVWPSLRRTQDLNDHVCTSFRPLQPLESSTSPDEADPASLAGVAANIELSENKLLLGSILLSKRAVLKFYTRQRH